MKNVWSSKREVSSILQGSSLVDIFFLQVDWWMEDVVHTPLRSLPPLPSFSSPGYLSSNWVIKKFKNIQEISFTTEISCERFDANLRLFFLLLKWVVFPNLNPSWELIKSWSNSLVSLIMMDWRVVLLEVDPRECGFSWSLGSFHETFEVLTTPIRIGSPKCERVSPKCST